MFGDAVFAIKLAGARLEIKIERLDMRRRAVVRCTERNIFRHLSRTR